mmetsp:Transcript_14574/g.22479  ORF Transcript_14574/g.22479 Transcript_14574/m.22479 type:complete len:686 (-) Transcript_14574:109-2166(-)
MDRLTFSLILTAVCLIFSVVVEARPIVRSIKSTHEFDRLLEKHSKETGLPVIADFYSDGCGPCRMMAPIFKKLAKEKKDEAVFIKIDTNAQYELSGRYSVRSIPTFVFFHNGKKFQEFSGAGEQQLRQYTDMIIGKAKDENVKLTLENLTAYYAEYDASKDADAVQSLLNKCAGSKANKNVDECVGASAFNLTRKLKKKYKKGPKLVPRFVPGEGADAETEQQPSSSSSSKQTKSKASNDPKTANLSLATMEELQAEIERRMDELRDAEADAEDEDDENEEDLHAFQRGSPFPQPVTIIGGGPAGLSAAIYAARSGLSPVVIAPPMGGQLLGKGVDVENYPGMFNVTGPEVVASMRAQAIEFGTTFEADVVTRVDTSSRPFRVYVNETDEPIETHAIIVATGAESNWLGIPGEYELRGGGVSSCAICDGAIYKGKDVVIVGGGDAAMEDALVLARTSSSVTLVHRRREFRASKILAQRVMEHPLITIRWDTIVTEIVGESIDDDKRVVKSAVLSNVVTGETDIIPTDAVFVAIGHTPATQFLNNANVQYNEAHPGYLMTYEGSTKTSIPGIFAAGDVSDAIYRQAITSAGSGAAAALDAERWLSEEGLGNEAAEMEAELMAELMSESHAHEKSAADAHYNVYEDAGGANATTKARRKDKVKNKDKSTAPPQEDVMVEEDESVLEL